MWITAVLAAFATSTIHPLSAAMLALALTAFGGLHGVLNWRQPVARQRVFGIALLTVAVMLLPMVQLILSRGAEPLADSFPTSFEAWPLQEKAIPAFPFADIKGLDLYGSLPDFAQLEPSQAYDTNSPFLLWRFDVNLNRQRLIIFDINRYILNPRLMLEPPYLLALFLLLFLLRRLRQGRGGTICSERNGGDFCRDVCAVCDAADWIACDAMDFVAICVAVSICADHRGWCFPGFCVLPADTHFGRNGSLSGSNLLANCRALYYLDESKLSRGHIY